MIRRALRRGWFSQSKRQVPKQIITKANQVQTSEQQIQKNIELRIKQLQRAHRQTQQLIDKQIKFPVKLCGTSDQYQKKFAYLPDRIMSYYKIPNSRVTDYLLNMFKASLYAIADRNTMYMNQYWEDGLKDKVLVAIDEAKEKNFKIYVEKNQSYVDQIAESCQIIDSVMMRGLSIDRTQNKHPKQYIKFSQPDQMGYISYTPQHLTQNNENFIDPEKNKTVYDGYDRMLLRTLVRIKTPLRLIMPEFNVSNQIYTWQHICVMQNQMFPLKPLQSSYKLETLMEWLGKYRFGPWRITDIDNFMFGNSPFRLHEPEPEDIDPVFKNTKLDKSYYIDIRKI